MDAFEDYEDDGEILFTNDKERIMNVFGEDNFDEEY